MQIKLGSPCGMKSLLGGLGSYEWRYTSKGTILKSIEPISGD